MGGKETCQGVAPPAEAKRQSEALTPSSQLLEASLLLLSAHHYPVSTPLFLLLVPGQRPEPLHRGLVLHVRAAQRVCQCPRLFPRLAAVCLPGLGMRLTDRAELVGGHPLKVIQPHPDTAQRVSQQPGYGRAFFFFTPASFSVPSSIAAAQSLAYANPIPYSSLLKRI